jgi:predicted kinase
MIRFFGPDRHERAWEEEARNRLEQALFDMALRVLALGTNVILDFGVWSRSEREDFRGRAAAIGARSELHFVDAPLDELIRRVHARNAALPPGTYPITEQEMREFATWLERPEEDEWAPREPDTPG